MNSKWLELVQQSSARLIRESFSPNRSRISSLAWFAYLSNRNLMTLGDGGFSFGNPLRSNSWNAGVTNWVNGQFEATVARIKSSSNCSWLTWEKIYRMSAPLLLVSVMTDTGFPLGQASRWRFTLCVEPFIDEWLPPRGWGYSTPHCWHLMMAAFRCVSIASSYVRYVCSDDGFLSNRTQFTCRYISMLGLNESYAKNLVRNDG